MIRRIAPALALVVAAASGAARADEPLWAVLRDRAEVKGLALTLGDVADVGGLDAAAVLAAAGLPLGRTPPPGQSRLLLAETVAALLDKARPEGPRITLRGAAAVCVSAPQLALSSEEVAALARRALANLLGDRAGPARIEPSNRPAPLTAPAGRWSTRFEVAPLRDPEPAGLVRLTVQAVVDGTIVAGVDADFVVHRSRPVVVARTDLHPGRPVESSQLAVETREAGGRGETSISDPSLAVGLVPKNRILAGSAVAERDFRRPPAVQRNDPVIVQVRAGNLTVRGEGIALGDGSPGDVIPVRTVPGRQVVQAQVVDSRTVAVVLESAKGQS